MTPKRDPDATGTRYGLRYEAYKHSNPHRSYYAVYVWHHGRLITRRVSRSYDRSVLAHSHDADTLQDIPSLLRRLKRKQEIPSELKMWLPESIPRQFGTDEEHHERIVTQRTRRGEETAFASEL